MERDVDEARRHVRDLRRHAIEILLAADELEHLIDDVVAFAQRSPDRSPGAHAPSQTRQR